MVFHMVRLGVKNYDFHMVFGRFPAELGPETVDVLGFGPVFGRSPDP